MLKTMIHDTFHIILRKGLSMKRSYVLSVLLLFVSAPVLAEGIAPPENTVIAEACRDDVYLLQLFCLGQLPHNKNIEPIKVLINHGYVVGYSEMRRNPIWTVFKASGLSSGSVFRFERSQFFSRDLRTVAQVHGQTFGGGYDRGHMVPNFVIANQYGSLAQMETFLMSNMCPQKADLNQKSWAQLEKFVTLLAEERDHVFVFAGPIFGDDPQLVERGESRKIQIPDAFYKIIVDTDREFTINFDTGSIPKVEIISYIFPQDTPADADFRDREKFGASVDEIEERTGLDFFPGAEQIGGDRWKERESEKVMVHWTVLD